MAKIHNPQDQDGILLINQTVFNKEVERATVAESVLSTVIEDEIKRAKQNGNNLQGNIDVEAAARKEADNVLQGNIDAEIERATTNESVLSTIIEDEIKRAKQKDNELQDNINAEIERATTNESVLSTVIENEIKRSTQKDIELQGNIDAEIERATTNESVLSTVIKDEIKRAKQKDIELQDTIDTEIQRATRIESALSTVIDDEIQRATQKDDELQGNIDVVTAAIQTEALTRLEKDNLLKSDIEDIAGAKKVSFLSDVPETAVSWVGVAINEAQGSNIIGDKLVKAIEFKTTTAVDSSCFLAVYTPGTGTPPAKELIALSEPTTISAGTTIFKFATPFSWNQQLELYVVDSKDNAPSTSSGDPALPTVSITSPAIADANGSTWKRQATSAAWGNPKYTFHIIYHLAGQIDIVEHSLTEKINTETTARTELAGQVDVLNGNLSALNGTVGDLATKDSLIESTLSKLNDKINFIGDTVIIGNENLLADSEKSQADVDGFRLVSPKTGYLKSIKLKCRPNNAKPVRTYLKISDNENNLIAVSDNDNLHENNAIHVYDFNIKLVKVTKGETYKFIFVSNEEGESSVSPSPCIRTTINITDSNTTFNREALYGGKLINFDGTDTDINAQAIIEMEFITNVAERLEAIIDALPHHEDNRYKFTISNDNISAPSEDGSTSRTIVLALNKEDAQIITANATYNSKQFEPQINGNELTLQFTLESTDNTGNIIINTICDSPNFDNAQYVCHVIPVNSVV